MSHNLFGERFGDQRYPAWHELGQVFGEPISASKAYKRLGPYEVRIADLKADGVQLEQRAILRNPTTDDPETRVFGIVGKDYHLVTPDDFVTIWDERVGREIETIGALGAGETFFISTYLPKLDVRGDEVEFYLLGKLTMTGLHSNEVMTTGVRTVCQNTLNAAESSATQRFKVVHDQYVLQRMGDWLQELVDEAETEAKMLAQVFDLLAGTKVKQAHVTEVLEDAYPYPKAPAKNAPQNVVEQRIQWWNENVNLMDRRRDGAQALFEGMGTGMDVPAAKGTLWGVYNSVVECEDYRRGKNETTPEGRARIAESIMFGERAAAKKRAFKSCHEMAKTLA